MLANHRALRTVLFCFLAVTVTMPAWAGWNKQVVLGDNAYSGTATIDAAGNMTSVWFQSGPNEIWASTAAFGQPWSAPVDISGSVSTSGGNPSVRGSASGNATAIYTNPSGGASFVDHPAGGVWGTPGATNGVNQFYVSNDNGDQGLAWGTGGARATSSTVNAVQRPAGGNWSAATTIASGVHLAFDGSVMAPDGSMAVAWESFNAVCGSRTCTTSNWVLHVSTHAAGAQNWVDSGALLGPDSKQHFGQLAADGVGDLGVLSLSGGNLVSLVRHGSSWTGPAIVASTSTFQFYTGTGRDNRVFASDSAGHATVVGWGDIHLSTLAAVDGNLTTNTWGTAKTISGSDQFPGYFDFTMSSSGAAIAFYWVNPNDGSGNTIWRAATRAGAGKPWSSPATAGTSFDAGGTPEGVAINGAGQAVVVFHGYSSDFLTYIEYTNTYQP
jgi:hypothetical protein